MLKIKFVYNNCFGGFSISQEAGKRLRELKCKNSDKIVLKGEKDKWGRENTSEDIYSCDLDRTDPMLVQVVEELGEKASGLCSKLKIGTAYIEISFHDYDGKETPYGIVHFDD